MPVQPIRERGKNLTYMAVDAWRELNGANGLPEFESLCLNDLSPTSRSDLQLVAPGGDEELFKATAKMVVELQDYGGTTPFGVIEPLTDECPSLAAKHGEQAIEQRSQIQSRSPDDNGQPAAPADISDYRPRPSRILACCKWFPRCDGVEQIMRDQSALLRRRLRCPDCEIAVCRYRIATDDLAPEALGQSNSE